MWHKELWLIDHGAAFYFHHSWQNLNEQAIKPFPQVKDHVLLPFASELDATDEAFRAILTHDKIESIVALIPDEWLVDETSQETVKERRQVYTRFLQDRISNSQIFVNEAKHAREAII
jgi:hypothetical protein